MDSRYYDDPDAQPDAPLLGLDELDSDNEVDSHDVGGPAAGIPAIKRIPNAKWYQVKTPKQIIVVIAIYLFCLVLSGMIAIFPIFRLMEDIFCRRHFQTDDPIPEEKCKIDDVQAPLAMFGGIMALVQGIMTFLTQLPWGILSDRVGRKPVLWFSVLSLMISGTWSMMIIQHPHIFPIELMLLSPLFLVFGGGVDTKINIIHSIIADVAADRTTAFLQTGIGAVVGLAVGPLLSAILLENWGPWPALMTSGAILTPVMFITFIILPETLPEQEKEDEPALLALPTTATPHKTNEPLLASIRVTARKTADQVRTGFRESMGILRDKSVQLLLLPFFLVAIASASWSTFGQSISLRFGWTLAHVAYLFSAKGVITITVLVALPFLSKALSAPAQEISISSTPEISRASSRKRWHVLPASPFGRDYRLLQFSIALVLLGSLLMGTPALGSMLAGGVVATCGVGISSFAKSLIAVYVESSQTAKLYTLTGMVETVGQLLAGPTLAWTFGTGARAGGLMVGLPFFYIVVLCAGVMVALMFVRPPRPRGIALGDGPPEDQA